MSVERILLTGANGFVGGQLLTELNDNEVIILGRTPLLHSQHKFFKSELRYVF